MAPENLPNTEGLAHFDPKGLKLTFPTDTEAEGGKDPPRLPKLWRESGSLNPRAACAHGRVCVTVLPGGLLGGSRDVSTGSLEIV